MINAKEELELALRGENIEAMEIKYRNKTIKLCKGHYREELEEAMNRLDFEYDNGFGGQELFGIVWIKSFDGWLERKEYDGSEWWEYKVKPKIPDYLL